MGNTSTDAINGSQLYAVAKVADLANTTAAVANSTAIAANSTATVAYSTASTAHSAATSAAVHASTAFSAAMSSAVQASTAFSMDYAANVTASTALSTALKAAGNVSWNIAITGNTIGEAASTVRGVNIQLTQSGRAISVALSRHIAVDSVTATTVNATTVNADTVNADTVNVKNLKAKGSTIFGGAGTSVTIVNGIYAVNYAQFQELSNRVNNMKTTSGLSRNEFNHMNSRMTSAEHRIGAVEDKLSNICKEMRGLGASIAAGMSLSQANVVGKSMIGAAVGTYKDKSAVVAWSRTTDSGKAVIKITGTANFMGDFFASAGIGFQY